MAKDPSPLLGYNNNIRHKNRVFHVQTEDSGVRHPHIITHLFMDGGRILKSVKTSYAEHLGVEKMADLVRKMMKDQHKGMLIALRDGQFDQVIDGGDSSPKPVAASASGPVAAAPAPPAVVPAPASPAPAPAASAQLVSAPRLAGVVEAPGADVAPPPPPPAPASVPRPQAPRERIDAEELERAASQAPPPVFEPAPTDLQPPPANLFRPRPGGIYSTVVTPPPPNAPKPASGGSSRPGARPGTVRPAAAAKPPTVPPAAAGARSGNARPGPAGGRPAHGGSPPHQPPIRRGSSPPPPLAGRRPVTGPVVTAKAPESRYASARPAAIFGQAKPRSGSSIFGEDIISDKSLDEVIMSYLADDGKDAAKSSDPKRRK
jgi:hypothetical protein